MGEKAESRQLLHCSNQSFERGASLYVFSQGQRLDDTWTLKAMNVKASFSRQTKDAYEEMMRSYYRHSTRHQKQNVRRSPISAPSGCKCKSSKPSQAVQH